MVGINPMSPEAVEQTPSIVPLKFWKDHEEDPAKAGELREVEWVEYAKKGQNGATSVEKVGRIKKHSPIIWSAIEGYYEAWAKGQEDPVDGTPLSAWPGVTRGMADKLKSLNLRTVEDIAMLTDADLERVGHGARALQSKAFAFVEAQQDRSKVAAILAEKDGTISQMQEQIAELTATVEKLTANKPKRGRPRNTAESMI